MAQSVFPVTILNMCAHTGMRYGQVVNACMRGGWGKGLLLCHTFTALLTSFPFALLGAP